MFCEIFGNPTVSIPDVLGTIEVAHKHNVRKFLENLAKFGDQLKAMISCLVDLKRISLMLA